MLAAFQSCHVFGRDVVLGAGAGEGVEDCEGGQAAFHAVLAGGGHGLRVIERTDGNGDAFRGVIGEAEWRAAIPAEATLDDLGAAEEGRLALRPVKSGLLRAHQRREVISEGLLAHAAMADVRVLEGRRDAVAHGATLAAAGGKGVGHASSVARKDAFVESALPHLIMPGLDPGILFPPRQERWPGRARP